MKDKAGCVRFALNASAFGLRLNDVRGLLAFGFHPDPTPEESESSGLFATSAFENCFYLEQNTPVRHAIARMLLDAGADIDRLNTVWGRTALMDMCCEGRLEDVMFLMEMGADPHVVSRGGSTAMKLARKNNKKAVVEYLKALELNKVITACVSSTAMETREVRKM